METVVEGIPRYEIHWLVREDALKIVAKGLFRESKISNDTDPNNFSISYLFPQFLSKKRYERSFNGGKRRRKELPKTM